jgi:hypothetical protein
MPDQEPVPQKKVVTRRRKSAFHLFIRSFAKPIRCSRSKTPQPFPWGLYPPSVAFKSNGKGRDYYLDIPRRR